MFQKVFCEFSFQIHFLLTFGQHSTQKACEWERRIKHKVFNSMPRLDCNLNSNVILYCKMLGNFNMSEVQKSLHIFFKSKTNKFNRYFSLFLLCSSYLEPVENREIGIKENLLRAMINNGFILNAIHRWRGSRTFCNLNLLLANPFSKCRSHSTFTLNFWSIVSEVIEKRKYKTRKC